VHIHNYGYSRPYDWYYSQPTFYVGGGYSSAFWWMMMTDWTAERRAYWLYHNQANIERDAYERGMKDAAVAAEIAKLKAQGVKPNPDYVDKEFSDNPDLMYDQDYVEAAYNPVVVEEHSSGVGTVLLWFLVIIIAGAVVCILVFKVRWGR
jgi:hypothetical protein